MIGLNGQPLELLGEFEQFRFDVGANHKTDERPDLTPLLAIVIRPGFRFRHNRVQRLASLLTTITSKATKSGNLVTGLTAAGSLAHA